MGAGGVFKYSSWYGRAICVHWPTGNVAKPYPTDSSRSGTDFFASPVHCLLLQATPRVLEQCKVRVQNRIKPGNGQSDGRSQRVSHTLQPVYFRTKATQCQNSQLNVAGGYPSPPGASELTRCFSIMRTIWEDGWCRMKTGRGERKWGCCEQSEGGCLAGRARPLGVMHYLTAIIICYQGFT